MGVSKSFGRGPEPVEDARRRIGDGEDGVLVGQVQNAGVTRAITLEDRRDQPGRVRK